MHTLSSRALLRHLPVDSESTWKILDKCLETRVFTVCHSSCKRELWNIMASKKIKWNQYRKGGDGRKIRQISLFWSMPANCSGCLLLLMDTQSKLSKCCPCQDGFTVLNAWSCSKDVAAIPILAEITPSSAPQSLLMIKITNHWNEVAGNCETSLLKVFEWKWDKKVSGMM